MAFKVGDKVKVIDETSVGIITNISALKRKYTVEIEGFEYVYTESQLLLIQSMDELHIISNSAEEKEVLLGEYKKGGNRNTKKNEFVREVDLHIYELIDSTRGMTNGEILSIQLEHFKKCLAKAIQNREKKIVFIHGVGEGILKGEIRAQLAKYDGISFEDASYSLYGKGATEVSIHYNKL